MRHIVAAGLLLPLLSACATGAPGSARRICYNSGLQPGTPEFSSCWKGERTRQFAYDGAILRNLVETTVAIGALAAGGALSATPAPSAAPARPTECRAKPGRDGGGNPVYVCK